MLPASADRGLCAICEHAQQVVSQRGSIFSLCRKNFVDPEFAKYPRLPVIVCRGFTGIDEEHEPDGFGQGSAKTGGTDPKS